MNCSHGSKPGKTVCLEVEVSMKSSVLMAGAAVAAAALPLLANAGPAAPPPFKAEKCFGIAAAGQNDCQTATHSCAGESKAAR